MLRQCLASTAALAFFVANSGFAAEPDLVRLGNLKFAHYGAVSYMKDLCGKYNLRVDEHVFVKGADIMPAVVSGDIDVTASAGEAAISARGNGVPLYVVAGFASGGVRIVAGSDTGIKQVKDLKGKRVGVTRGGTQELYLFAALEKAGLTWSDRPGKDVQITFLNYPDLNQALAAKQLDAIAQSEPQSSQAINKGFGVEVTKPYDTALGVPVRLLVMTEKMYAKRDIALRFMKCFVDATTKFRGDMKFAEKYVRESMFKGQITAQDFADAMSNAQYIYDETPEHIQVNTDFMQRFGVGKMANPPKATDWVKLDLLKEAKTALKVN